MTRCSSNEVCETIIRWVIISHWKSITAQLERFSRNSTATKRHLYCTVVIPAHGNSETFRVKLQKISLNLSSKVCLNTNSAELKFEPQPEIKFHCTIELQSKFKCYCTFELNKRRLELKCEIDFDCKLEFDRKFELKHEIKCKLKFYLNIDFTRPTKLGRVKSQRSLGVSLNLWSK